MYIKDWSKLLFPPLSKLTVCKLKFLIPILDFTPTPNVISQVMRVYLNHVNELT